MINGDGVETGSLVGGRGKWFYSNMVLVYDAQNLLQVQIRGSLIFVKKYVCGGSWLAFPSSLIQRENE